MVRPVLDKGRIQVIELVDFKISDENKRKKARKDIEDYKFTEVPEPNQIKNLAEDNCKFFKDQYGIGYALIKIHKPTGHYESVPLDSNRFKLYLMKLFYDESLRKIAHKENINSAIELLKAGAEFEGKIHNLNIRVAMSEDKKSIYYDLAEENWYCIKIDKNGYYLEMGIDFPLFKRYSQSPLPIPEMKYEPGIFDKFMSLTNIKKKDDILLTKVWMIGTFIPYIAHA